MDLDFMWETKMFKARRVSLEDAEVIRAQYAGTRIPMIALAAEYGVSTNEIFKVIHRYGKYAPGAPPEDASADDGTVPTNGTAAVSEQVSRPVNTLFDLTPLQLRDWVIDLIRPELWADGYPHVPTPDDFDWEEATPIDRKHLAALGGQIFRMRYPNYVGTNVPRTKALETKIYEERLEQIYAKFAALRDTSHRDVAIAYFTKVRNVNLLFFASLFNVSPVTASRWASVGEMSLLASERVLNG